jgi:hypothetical protein
VNRSEKIIFYFPFATVGGVSILFLRASKLLSKTREVFLMDLPDGYMAKNLPEGVGFFSAFEKDRIPSNSIVIMQACYPWRIPDFEKFPATARILLWNLHPDNFFPHLFYGMRNHPIKKFIYLVCTHFRKKRGREFVYMLIKQNSLQFMDKPNFLGTCSHLGISLNKPKSFLRIMTDDSVAIARSIRQHEPSSKKRFGWLGRIEDFKTPILLHTLERLNNLKLKNMEFVIIGSGRDLEQVRSFVKDLEEMNIEFVGEVPFEEATLHISRLDLLFAMGTSALEGAKQFVPTILTDYSFDAIKGLYRFQMIYQKEGYSVGDRITSDHLESECSLNSLIEEVCNHRELHGQRCYDYWKENFSPEVFLREFPPILERALMTCGEVVESGIHRPDFITRLVYGIRKLLGKSRPREGWAY